MGFGIIQVGEGVSESGFNGVVFVVDIYLAKDLIKLCESVIGS